MTTGNSQTHECSLCMYVASHDFKTKYWADETYGHNILLLLIGWDYPNFKAWIKNILYHSPIPISFF